MELLRISGIMIGICRVDNSPQSRDGPYRSNAVQVVSSFCLQGNFEGCCGHKGWILFTVASAEFVMDWVLCFSLFLSFDSYMVLAYMLDVGRGNGVGLKGSCFATTFMIIVLIAVAVLVSAEFDPFSKDILRLPLLAHIVLLTLIST